MDFDFDEEEQAIADLTAQILDDQVTHESLRELTADPDVDWDADLWALLADAGILGAALPEQHGGAGLDFLAVTAALEQIGRTAAPIPFLETVVMGGLTIAEFGTPALQDELLERIATGRVYVTAALVPGEPVTVDADACTGVLTCVPFGMHTDVILVPTTDGMRVIDVEATGDTMTRTEQATTTGHPQARIELAGTPSQRLGSAATDDVLAWLRPRVDSAICSMLAGACQAALKLAADYAQQRHQFDRPIATFQAVSQRAGDAYIDTEAVNLTSRQAAWRISAGRHADEQVAIARWWASEAGFRVMHAATHLHGGVGVDRDYPLHRYFLMTRQLELTLGNAEEQLARLGDLIAERS
ncbi:MAG: acyl-CoA dehydrogenase family protein [Actinomycetota bacterium]